jgi:hypothetical protein
MESALLAGMRRRVRSSVREETWAELVEQVTQRALDPWSAAGQLLGAVESAG